MIEKNILTVNILEGIEKSEGCPLCYLWAKSEERYVKQVLTNEVVMDPVFREKVVAARGFCNRHAHMLYITSHEIGVEDGLGYALYMRDVIERAGEQLSSLLANLFNVSGAPKGRLVVRKGPDITGLKRLVKRWVKNVTKRQRCPICEHLWSMDQIHLHTLVKMLDDEDFRKDFNSSKWLCLPHFISVIMVVCVDNLNDPIHIARALLDSEIKQLQLIKSLLSEFIRKQSWNFRNERAGPEVNASRLALNFLAGVEGFHTEEIHG